MLYKYYMTILNKVEDKNKNELKPDSFISPKQNCGHGEQLYSWVTIGIITVMLQIYLVLGIVIPTYWGDGTIN